MGNCGDRANFPTCKNMNILWFTWKDLKHPLAGGAERVNQEIAKRCVMNGHHVIFVTGGFSGAVQEEILDGCCVIRLGTMWSVHWRAREYYKNNLRGWADVVIEEINTLPFLTRWYANDVKDHKRPLILLFFHQLNREVWFHQMRFPLGVMGSGWVAQSQSHCVQRDVLGDQSTVCIVSSLCGCL